MPIYTIETPRGRRVKIEADDEATAVAGAQRWDHEDFTISESERLGVDPNLALRQLGQESRFNPAAVSPKGARGLMQLMPETAKDLGVDPDDPYQNITGGLTYFKQMRDKFGSDDLALAAYNAGPGAVEKYGGIPPYRETQNYVRSILSGEGEPPEAAPRTPQSPPRRPGASPQLAPLGAPPASAPRRAADPARSDEMLGFEKGVTAPLDNAAIALRRFAHSPWSRAVAPVLPEAAQAIDMLSDATGGQTPEAVKGERAKYFEREVAGGRAPGKIGEFVGNMAGTIALSRLPGGPLTQGAATGALLSEGDDVVDVARDAAMGAVFSKAGDMVGRTAGGLVRGVTDKSVQALAKAGVPLTPGQLAGGAFKRAEDAATSIPFVGDVIRAGQRRSVEGLNTAALNRALAPIGEKLPQGLIGREAFEHADDVLSQRYSDLLPTLKVQADKGFVGAMTNLRDLAKSMPADHRQVFEATLQREVLGRFAPKTGRMSGEAMKAAEETLGREIRAIRMNPQSNPWDRKLADAYQEAQSQLRQLVGRNNPAKAAELRAINTGWANLKRVEDATSAAGAVDGVFTAPQLSAAVKRNTPKRQFAKGQGLMQDLADAGKKVLPSSVPDSGTATRAMLGMVGGGLGANAFGAPLLAAPLLAGAGAAALYSKTGQGLATKAATSRPALAQPIGKALQTLSPVAANAAAVAWLTSRRPNGPKKRDQKRVR